MARQWHAARNRWRFVKIGAVIFVGEKEYAGIETAASALFLQHGNPPDFDRIRKAGEFFLAGNSALTNLAKKFLRFGALINFIGENKVVAAAMADEPRGEIDRRAEKIEAVIGIDREARAGVKAGFQLQARILF